MRRDHDLEERLRAVPVLARLTNKQIKKLRDRSKVVEHNPGAVVTGEGNSGLALHVILDGAAEVSAKGEVLRTLGVGDYFGEISMIDAKRRSATVRADGELTTLAVPHLVFLDLLEHDFTATKALLVALCARIREHDGYVDPLPDIDDV